MPNGYRDPSEEVRMRGYAGYTQPTQAPAQQNSFQQLLSQVGTREEEARTANIRRYKQAMAIYDEIIKRYQPSGPFQASALQQLGVQKVADVGAGAQRMISGGLFGTEAAAGLETGWEQAVGAPARLKLEDIMMQRLSEAQVGKAGFIERREDEYPDYGLLAQLAAQGGTAGGGAGGRTYERTINFPTKTPSETQWMRSAPVTPATGGYTYPESTSSKVQMGPGYGPAFERPTTPTAAPTDQMAGKKWPTGQGPMKAGGPMMEFEYNPYTGERRNIRPLGGGKSGGYGATGTW